MHCSLVCERIVSTSWRQSQERLISFTNLHVEVHLLTMGDLSNNSTGYSLIVRNRQKSQFCVGYKHNCSMARIEWCWYLQRHRTGHGCTQLGEHYNRSTSMYCSAQTDQSATCSPDNSPVLLELKSKWGVAVLSRAAHCKVQGSASCI